MVKGINRQVIVVKSPDPKLFDQAIFILREEVVQGEGVSADQILQEAQQVAKDYVKAHGRWGRIKAGIPKPACVALGALVASVAWSLAFFL